MHMLADAHKDIVSTPLHGEANLLFIAPAALDSVASDRPAMSMFAQVGVAFALQGNNVGTCLRLEADGFDEDLSLPMVPQCVLGAEIMVGYAVLVRQDELGFFVRLRRVVPAIRVRICRVKPVSKGRGLPRSGYGLSLSGHGGRACS